jgi:hypothetical protein
MSRLIVSLSFVVTVLFVGCGDSYSSDESKTKCDLERQANSTCFTDATYNQCLSCYESCGTDCAVAESCPVQYTCPE